MRRWRFDGNEGNDRFETELLEHVAGDGLVPLATWTYERAAEPVAVTPIR